ncbi:hypothetical protein DPMN_130725 [Dreissena polymorpha]|uniref:Uncharacterized protein n=1 Tax=Dreissena polymorpha TaxID=45954 RepID=A0A9D4H541_DREPO|nr:hypothetical protein DPMN_130725 [Dreissena polymorpha]
MRPTYGYKPLNKSHKYHNSLTRRTTLYYFHHIGLFEDTDFSRIVVGLDRQTECQTERNINRHTYRQTDRHTGTIMAFQRYVFVDTAGVLISLYLPLESSDII